MALPIKNTRITEIAGLDTFYNGGKGSGNFGHSGRPGEVGGSGKGTGDKTSGDKNISSEDSKGIRKDIKSWVDGEQDEHDPTALKSILKSVDDSMSRAGLNPKDSVKTWEKLVKEERESVGGDIIKPSSKAEGLQAIVGMVKTHLANPDKSFKGDKVAPYYRKAYDGLRQLSDFLGGEDDITIRSDIDGPYIELQRKK